MALYLQKQLETNEIGTITMSPVTLSYNYSNKCTYENEANKPMTVFDARGIYAATPNNFDQLVLDYLRTWHSEAEIQTAEFKNKVESFANSVYWLTGSMSKGGIFFYKDSNGKLFFGCVYAFGYRMNGTTKEYAYLIGTEINYGIASDYALEQVCLGFTATPDEREDFPNMVMFSKQDNTSAHLWVYEPWNAQQYEDTTDLEEAVGNCDWSTGSPDVAWDNANVQQVLGNVSPFEEYSGSWSGGTAIDPSYNPYNDDSGPSDEDEPDRINPDAVTPDDPNASGIDACNSGFITLYNPSKQSVIDFNDFLFTGIDDTISQQLKRLIADPLDYLVFIAMCHFTPTSSAAQHEITFAGVDSGVSAPVISQQFISLDCGYLDIPMQNKNMSDFSPYSKIEIFLPYIGFRPLKIDEVRGARLLVGYNVDLMTGSFVCNVRAVRARRGWWTAMTSSDWELNSIILTEYGNCYEMLPLSSSDFRSFYSAIAGAVAGGATMATGNIAGGLASTASSVASMKPSVNRSTNGTGNAGYYGQQTPFVIITYPFSANPQQFGVFEGFPSNIVQSIGSCNNAYVEIDTDTIWMDDIPCLDDEMNEIKELLNKGVWVNV